MSRTLNELREGFDSLATSAQALTFGPRGLELQAAMRETIDGYLTDLNAAKAEAIYSRDEAGANGALAMELSLRVVRYELQMWIDLKSDAAASAWDNLVEAHL